jgi:hypothetical protein
MRPTRRSGAAAAAARAFAVAAAALLLAASAAAAVQNPAAPPAAIDLRAQAAEFSRAALADFEAQEAVRRKEEEPYIQPPGGEGEEGEGEEAGEAVAAATTGGGGEATTPQPAAEAAAPEATQQQQQQAAPPQPRAMAIARGAAHHPTPAAADDASATTPPPPPEPVFPTSFPPTPSATECTNLMHAYRAFTAREPAPFQGPEGDSLLYFLHIPRTAGRTFHVCLLRQATPPDRRCPKSYDHLRVDVSLPKCHLLSSHDDFSVVEKLPPHTSVVTQLRDPVDRFLSAYEFAAEVAARSVLKPEPWVRPATNKTVTEDVWPWSILVPWFVREGKRRIDAVDAEADAREEQDAAEGGHWIAIPAPDGQDFYYNAALNASSWTLTEEQRAHKLLPPLDPYDNPLLPSLLEFARHPVAQELLHDGQALQVLGLTNYSHWPQAPQLRACLFGRPEVRRELLDVAEKRLSKFAHVGTTGRLRDSVEAAAAAIGAPLLGSAFSPGSDDQSAATTLEGEAAVNSSALAAATPPSSSVTPVTSVAHPRMAELAAAARRAADRVRRAEDRWNAAVARTRQGLLPIGTDPRADPVAAAQPELRQLKAVLNRARAEVAAAQGSVVRERLALRASGWRPPPADDPSSPPLPFSPASLDPSSALPERVDRERERARLDGGLGAEFERCARRAQAKNGERRERSLINLMMPDGRTVSFTKQARAAIRKDVLDEIRRLSPMDDALHGLALRTLDERRAAAAREGRLQRMPPREEGGEGAAAAAASGSRKASRWAKVFPLPPGDRVSGQGAAAGAEL